MRRRALAAADVLALLGAYGVLWLLAPPPNSVTHDLALVVALPLWVVMNKSLRLYDRDANVVHRSTLNELPGLFHSLSLGTALAFLLGPLVPGVTMHRPQVVVWWLAALVLTPTLRCAARGFVRHRTTPERVLIVGAGQVASLVARKIESHPEHGNELVGYVDADDDALHAQAMGELRCLGTMSQFESICRETDAERVIVAFSRAQHERLLDVIRISKRLRVKISVVPRLFEVIGSGVEIDQVEGMTLMGIRGLARATLDARAQARHGRRRGVARPDRPLPRCSLAPRSRSSSSRGAPCCSASRASGARQRRFRDVEVPLDGRRRRPQEGGARRISTRWRAARCSRSARTRA